MGIPAHSLSSSLRPGAFLFPRNLTKRPLVDRHMGGTDIGDANAGLAVKEWVARYDVDSGEVTLTSDDVDDFVFLTAEGITEISLAFDQAMRPALAYVQEGVAKLRYYDTILGTYSTLTLTGASCPRICLDDTRPLQAQRSDIVLAYLRSGRLCYREQRDRFLVEYLLSMSPPTQNLVQIGMSNVNRVQFGFLPVET